VLRALLIMVAVSALATLPCLVLLLISLDDMFEHLGRRLRRFRRRRGGTSMGWRERRRLARLDRSLCPGAVPDAPAVPPIERIAADLRRLRRQRTGIALRSPVWFSAVEKAYDERLRLACGQLDIAGHLDELTGVDREIERVRMEGELEAAGLTLHGYEAAAS
jgi:hypothetical protein